MIIGFVKSATLAVISPSLLYNKNKHMSGLIHDMKKKNKNKICGKRRMNINVKKVG